MGVVVVDGNVTKEDLKVAGEDYGEYIKVVIDIRTGAMAIGGEWHSDAEKVLLDLGGKNEDLWGGGIDLVTHEVDYDSLINVRSGTNPTHVILDDQIRRKFKNILLKKFGYE